MEDRLDKILLVEPSVVHKSDILSYRQEFIESGDTMDGTAGLEKPLSFEEWLQNVGNDSSEGTVQEGYVPATQLLAVRESDGRVVGMVNIRRRLNDALLSIGGHIGYSVRPSERKKGYATEILRQALLVCGGLAINRVLVTCNEDNIASNKVIIANGGKLENTVATEEYGLIRRYWITS